MLSEDTILRFSLAQREMLIAHIDGPTAVVTDIHTVPVRRALLERRLIRGHPAGAIRPRHTALTEEGRRVVCVILGYYADMLVSAGLLEQNDPLSVLRQLKALRSGGSEPESFILETAAAEPLRIAKA